MDRAIKAWLRQSERDTNESDSAALKKLQKSYVVYGCMALLPCEAIDTLHQSHHSLDDLYRLIAKELKTTHIATSRPIPLHQQDGTSENMVRSPINFLPLSGDFAPEPTPNSMLTPIQSDFENAFWTTAKQNGIHQVWAPRYTMFSRGNISEKARLLTLPSVLTAVEDGRRDGRGCAAVDLYAGIGYFTFSYLKAGVSKVLGWDLSPWSVEGLRRGARANKWGAVTATDHEGTGEALEREDVRVLAFCESNERAPGRVEKARQLLPPIRHVNCGLLPTSRGSWGTAVELLDPRLEGWVHVHENFAIDEIEGKAEEVRVEIQSLVDQFEGDVNREGTKWRKVAVEHINRLKSYAPGVIHCVIDIRIRPRT
ncbi:hypothetical protein EJ03DRAFT_329053 [Teratosphaeria nubilosa]|uniref:tRNA wybutosine-synthesizing protein 2 n=1 Tax=Teratosphaeria nubilosa TaxID=161662 RepID=A0A6G1L573_9PEZI|nr:hypothetical protein EJ03DRAFT_329053 [Teratosphaeria nubilosa]